MSRDSMTPKNSTIVTRTTPDESISFAFSDSDMLLAHALEDSVPKARGEAHYCTSTTQRSHSAQQHFVKKQQTQQR
jgi:hypothetical protein